MRQTVSRLAVAMLMLAMVSMRLHSAEGALSLDDESLVAQMPGAGATYRLPSRVYPPELIAKLKGETARFGGYRQFMYRSVPQDAAKWISVPLERWAELISDFAPVSCAGNGGNPTTIGLSPFTGKLFAGAVMTDEEFLSSPFQAREAGTEAVIYAHEADMPADYAAKPNHTEEIPHLDGTVHAYRFFVAEEFREAGPEVGSARKNWFCPAGEVWRCRLNIIVNRVIPDLTAAIIYNNNREAVATLAAVLDRLAEVYPGLPLYIGAKAHGFARNRAGTGYLTAEEYRSITAEQPFIHVRDRADYPFWYRDIYDFSFAKLHGGVSAWTDGVMVQIGWIAGAFDLIRDQPETLAWSTAKYGDPAAWEGRFREGCLKEMEFLALATPPTTGNTSYAYIQGAVKAGIAFRNIELFSKGLELVELYMYNNWSADGMAADAAFNYAVMTQSGILGFSWLHSFFGGVDLKERYPLMETIDNLGHQPIDTLYGIVSKHADQHALIFRGGGPGPDPDQLPYETHEASLSLPIYGMTALRGGAEGRRLELIVNHQNAAQHAHLDRLSYQLFFEGVDCLPDFGYCIGFIEADKAPWSELRMGYELIGLPNEDTDRWGPWKWGYADKPEAHNVAMVDDWYHKTVPSQLYAYAGAGNMAEPGWWAQFVDAGAASLFAGRPNPVDIYQRQVALITLPGGSPVVLDLLRIRGGQRHDLFWRIPAERPEEMPKNGEPLDVDNWTQYRGLKLNYDRLTGKSLHHYARAGRMITGLTRYPLPEQSWKSDWMIQPGRTFPEPEGYRQNDGNWPRLLHDVQLGMWTKVAGSPAAGELIAAKAPWPGGLLITDPDSGQSMTRTVGLKDAIDVRILSREADQPGLESTFVSVVEARLPEQAAQLAQADILDLQPLADGGGAVVRLTMDDGSTGLFASTLEGGKLAAGSTMLTGRMGAVFPAANRLTLVDGSDFQADGWGVKLEPGWEMTLTDVDGDLTGNPRRSALIVRSTRPLPTDGTLNGHFVYVWHQPTPHGQSVYTIAGIADLGEGRWRVDLAGAPPFILQRARILKSDPDDARKFEQDFQFHHIMNQDNVSGRRIRFPRSGFETALVRTERSVFTTEDEPPAGAVVKGDPFIVYSIQAGDRVSIPSRFACSGTRNADGTLELDVQSTGAFALTMPMELVDAWILADQRDTVVMLKEPAGGGTVIVPRDSLRSGRGTLQFSIR